MRLVVLKTFDQSDERHDLTNETTKIKIREKADNDKDKDISRTPSKSDP